MSVRLQTLEQARRMIASGKSTDEALEFLSNTLMNRLLHAPTQALKAASESAEAVVIAAVGPPGRDDRHRQ